jgi:hypothetical protein
MADEIAVVDGGRLLRFTLEDLMRYHGPASPGGVAHAFKVMQRAWPLLCPGAPPERREIALRTAFEGPGARDAFELVTRAVTGGRFAVDPSLTRPDLGTAMERFVFRLAYRGRAVTLTVRDGYVPDELIELVRKQGRSAGEEARLAVVKQAMADRVTAAAPRDVYDARGETGGGPDVE